MQHLHMHQALLQSVELQADTDTYTGVTDPVVKTSDSKTQA